MWEFKFVFEFLKILDFEKDIWLLISWISFRKYFYFSLRNIKSRKINLTQFFIALARSRKFTFFPFFIAFQNLAHCIRACRFNPGCLLCSCCLYRVVSCYVHVPSTMCPFRCMLPLQGVYIIHVPSTGCLYIVHVPSTGCLYCSNFLYMVTILFMLPLQGVYIVHVPSTGCPFIFMFPLQGDHLVRFWISSHWHLMSAVYNFTILFKVLNIILKY